MNRRTNIELYTTDDVASKFLIFQKYMDVFLTMLDAGVFNQKNGSVSLHFDHEGTLRTIQRADVLYSKKHEQR